MTTESCNSRRFSRIMKSCFPNSTQSEYPRETTYLIKLSDKISSENSHHKTNFSSLPDDLLLECLSRVPLSSLSSISRVCRKWSNLIDSTTFFNLRRNRNLTFQTIFAISLTDFGICLANLRYENELSWKIACTQNVDSVMSQIIIEGSISHSRLIAIEKFIYILSRNSTVRYNTWTGGFSSRSTMLFPRKRFAAAMIAGKIYVGGGGGDRTGTVEEYNPETDTWQIISESLRRRYGCIGASVDGVFYLIGGLKISNRSDYCSRDATSTDARAYACSMDLYDIETRVWLRRRSVPGGGCVIAGCAVGGHVYVLMNHAVELSFWRFDGRRLLGGNINNNNGFGEWCRLKSPPLPAQVRLDNTVRFSCVGVGEEKVVLIQVMGCIDDLLRRSGRNCRGLKEGLVLVYDKGSGEWSRNLDLPEIFRRAACVCVEC